MGSGDSDRRTSGVRWPSSLGRRLLVLLGVVGLFGIALAISYGVTRAAQTVLEVGKPGSATNLLFSVAGFQLAGFGTILVVFVLVRDVEWRSYLRIGAVTEWVVFYGTAVGLTLMVVTAGATGIASLLDLQLTESTAGASADPLHYVAVFGISTFLAVPMEELFFRGLLQRRLEEDFHPGVAVAVASVLFAVIHTGTTMESTGELVAAGLFFALGVVLGVSYTLSENLFVPLIGHLVFNGIQIFVRALEVVA